MTRQAVARHAGLAIALFATIASGDRLLSFLSLSTGRCEFCGGATHPFREGDWEWVGSGIIECQSCGRLVDCKAWEFGQRLWAAELRQRKQSPAPAPQRVRRAAVL